MRMHEPFSNLRVVMKNMLIMYITVKGGNLDSRGNLDHF